MSRGPVKEVTCFTNIVDWLKKMLADYSVFNKSRYLINYLTNLNAQEPDIVLGAVLVQQPQKPSPAPREVTFLWFKCLISIKY